MKRITDASTSSVRRSELGAGSVPTNRRAFLRATAGAAALTTTLAAAGQTAADEEYDNVVNIVDDFGADNTGEEPINDALSDAIDWNTKVVFPDGDYWFDGPVRNQLVRNLALVGEGDATLRPTEDTASLLLILYGDRIHIENFTIDMTADDTSTGINVLADERLVIRDIMFTGAGDGPGGPTDDYGDNGERHGPFNIVPAVRDPDGTGLIENVHMPDGTVPYYRKGGVWVANEHAGHLLFNRCSFEGFSDNALYTSGAGVPSRGEQGSIGVENCFFRNNNVTAIRLGTPGSYAKNCTVVYDAGGIPELPWGAVTGRAGWVWYGFDGSYEDIDVVSNHPRGMGIYTYPGHTGSLRVSNCNFELNVDGTDAIRTFGDDGLVTVEGVNVVGEAGGDSAITFEGSEIDVENCCLHQTGDDRDGITLQGVTGAISNSAIDVTGEQIVADEETDVETTGISDEGECSAPDAENVYGPTPTPTPEPTPTPTPTATPEPTATPTPTDDDTESAATPGFTFLVTAGALATAAAAILRRATSDRTEE